MRLYPIKNSIKPFRATIHQNLDKNKSCCAFDPQFWPNPSSSCIVWICLDDVRCPPCTHFLWVFLSAPDFSMTRWLRFFNNGQTCCAAKRIYVQATSGVQLGFLQPLRIGAMVIVMSGCKPFLMGINPCTVGTVFPTSVRVAPVVVFAQCGFCFPSMVGWIPLWWHFPQ